MPSLRLSVSSVGSEAMQLTQVSHTLPFQHPFSILGRIGGDATLSPPAFALPGTWAFSILGRIGGDATYTADAPRPSRYELSVSSVGSEAMQRTTLCPCSGEFRNFQYPRSDRRRCNKGETGVAWRTNIAFQYPRSDRRRCNWGWWLTPSAR